MDDGLPSHHGPVVHFPCTTSVGMESELTSFLLAELACWLMYQFMRLGPVILFPKSNHHFGELISSQMMSVSEGGTETGRSVLFGGSIIWDFLSLAWCPGLKAACRAAHLDRCSILLSNIVPTPVVTCAQ